MMTIGRMRAAKMMLMLVMMTMRVMRKKKKEADEVKTRQGAPKRQGSGGNGSGLMALTSSKIVWSPLP